MKRLTPLEITHFYKSLGVVKEIYDDIINDSKIFEYVYDKINIKISSECDDINTKISSTYDVTLCEKYETMDIDENIFYPGVNTVLDNLVKEYDENWNIMKNYKEQLDITIKMDEKRKIPNTNDYVKLESTEKRGYSLVCTKTRFLKLKKLLELNNSPLVITSSPSTQSNVIIESNDFVEPLGKINRLRKNIKEVVNKTHVEFLEFFSDKKLKINSIITFIEMIDNLQNRAFVAQKYKYSKPSILSFLSSSSCVTIKNLRHPLIELLHDEPYVSNDLELGREKKGLLIYGTNAVGKTSLIRALGMSVVMAQCGYFVPASQFEYIPYKKIFSRILNTDNLFKGLSTFAVEMSELNVILNGCDSNSLILGDELCSGTEMESAKAIFVSGLQNIYSKNASFIFATHLHEITDYNEITNLENLSMKHMTVHYDYEKDKMIYDRKLKDGAGESMYGLEVCKSLNMPHDFLENAYSLRDKYLSEVSVLESKKSRYNSQKLINICEICNKNPATETHHKKEQNKADKNGFIGDMHKNHISNLIGICEECHKIEHKLSVHTI
jgi:DNA mismatch repair protein MutS